MKFYDFSHLPNVNAAILFGSNARGDSDEYSDLDLCIFCNDVPFLEIQKIRNKIASLLECKPYNISMYTSQKVKNMLAKGSLFMWHIKMEGKILFSRENYFENVFSKLEPYKRHKEDLIYYNILLEDIKLNLEKTRFVSEFDLSLLFTVCRNACMVICHLKGKPVFGRISVFNYMKDIYKDQVALDYETYYYLSKWKLWYSRGISPGYDAPPCEKMVTLIHNVGSIIELGLNECK